MHPKHKRALIRTSIIAVICAIPFVAKSYFIKKYATDEPSLNIALEPFFIETEEAINLSRHDLFGTVHVLLKQTKACDSACQDMVQEFTNEMNDKFGREFIDQETKRMRLLFFSDATDARASETSHRTKKHQLDLLYFSQNQFDEVLRSDEIIRSNEENLVLSIAIIDPRGHLVYLDEMNRESLAPEAMQKLLAKLSKINFNHYLSDYLGKRTFFGPRRENPGA